MLEGFKHADLNNIDSFASAMSPSVAAVMIETIQGEGGIFLMKPNSSPTRSTLSSESLPTHYR